MMYIWDSKALKQYGHGHIAVVAGSVDEARQKVLDRFDYCLQSGDHDDWFESFGGHLWDMEDEDDVIKMKDTKNLLIQDMSSEPTISDMLLTPGSC